MHCDRLSQNQWDLHLTIIPHLKWKMVCFISCILLILWRHKMRAQTRKDALAQSHTLILTLTLTQHMHIHMHMYVVCMYVCMYVCTHARTHALMHARTRMNKQTTHAQQKIVSYTLWSFITEPMEPEPVIHPAPKVENGMFYFMYSFNTLKT